MSKTVDVDLRIRAKNLSKSALKDITDDVEKLTQAQSEQAKSADLASRSMKELLAEQQRAAALARELASRQNLLKRYADERAEVESLSNKLVELTETRKRVASAAARRAPARSWGRASFEEASQRAIRSAVRGPMPGRRRSSRASSRNGSG